MACQSTPWLGLCLGLLVALAVHALAIPVVAHWMVEGRRVARLQVEHVQAPAEAAPGEHIRVEWRITNTGDGVTRGQRRDRIALASTPWPGSPDDVLVREEKSTHAPIAPGDSASAEAALTIPSDFEGDAWIIVQTALADGHRHHRSVPIRVAPYLPNLEVETLAAEPEAGVAGLEIEIEFRVRNTGRAAAEGRWADRVYLSERSRLGLDAHGFATRGQDEPLGPGESYRQRLTWTVPDQAPGLYYLILRADDDDRLDEIDKADNIRALPFEIHDPDAADRPFPDLVMADVAAPSRALAGEPIEVGTRVVNIGDAPAEGPWTDRVMLSEHPYPDDEAETLGAARTKGSLTPDGSYEQRYEVVIPEGLAGRYYLVAWADSEGELKQRSERNSFKAVEIDIRETPEVAFGEDDGRHEPTVAWISWDDYQDLVAPYRPEQLHQPWLEPDSAPPAGGEAAASQQSPPEPEPREQPSPPPPPDPESAEALAIDPQIEPDEADVVDPLDPQLAEAEIEIPTFAEPDPDPLPEDGDGGDDPASAGDVEDEAESAESARIPAEGDQQHEPASPEASEPDEAAAEDQAEGAPESPEPGAEPGPEAAEAAGEAGEQGDRRGPAEAEADGDDPDAERDRAVPTARRRVPPISPDEPQTAIRPGRVETVAGVQIHPDSPRLPMSSRLAPWAANPVVRLTFNDEGRVVSHHLVRSSGDRTRDAEIISGLYRWRANGEQLEENFPDGFWAEFKLIFIEQR